jgi:DNA invertase Pin-like site-specific DNA recombinase
MVHLLAAFAEHEREQISQRTKAALQAAKSRGIRLGVHDADRLAPANRAEAMERRQLAPILTELKAAGMSARQMAAELNGSADSDAYWRKMACSNRAANVKPCSMLMARAKKEISLETRPPARPKTVLLPERPSHRGEPLHRAAA